MRRDSPWLCLLVLALLSEWSQANRAQVLQPVQAQLKELSEELDGMPVQESALDEQLRWLRTQRQQRQQAQPEVPQQLQQPAPASAPVPAAATELLQIGASASYPDLRDSVAAEQQRATAPAAPAPPTAPLPPQQPYSNIMAAPQQPVAPAVNYGQITQSVTDAVLRALQKKNPPPEPQQAPPAAPAPAAAGGHKKSFWAPAVNKINPGSSFAQGGGLTPVIGDPSLPCGGHGCMATDQDDIDEIIGHSGHGQAPHVPQIKSDIDESTVSKRLNKARAYLQSVEEQTARLQTRLKDMQKARSLVQQDIKYLRAGVHGDPSEQEPDFDDEDFSLLESKTKVHVRGKEHARAGAKHSKHRKHSSRKSASPDPDQKRLMELQAELARLETDEHDEHDEHDEV